MMELRLIDDGDLVESWSVDSMSDARDIIYSDDPPGEFYLFDGDKIWFYEMDSFIEVNMEVYYVR